MKPIKATIPDTVISGGIFSIRHVDQPYFGSEFHFHKECQLAFIARGSGKRIVGDSVEHFGDGELVFIGPDVPHVWYNARSKAEKTGNSQSISLFISAARLLEHLSAFGDTQQTEDLLNKSARGMRITGKTKVLVIALLKKAVRQTGIKHSITLLRIIYILSITHEYELLASKNYVNKFQFRDNERMDSVYRYVLGNFRTELRLNDVASVAGMNPQAFCRFFKSRTQQSFTNFVNEVRIGHACKLLNTGKETVALIARECGFNNVSNFNRFFKKVKKINPTLYRKQLDIH